MFQNTTVYVKLDIIVIFEKHIQYHDFQLDPVSACIRIDVAAREHQSHHVSIESRRHIRAVEYGTTLPLKRIENMFVVDSCVVG